MKCGNPACAIYGLEDSRVVLMEHDAGIVRLDDDSIFYAECTVCGWRGVLFPAKDRVAALAILEGKP